MTEKEGVIKYDLTHRDAAPPRPAEIAMLDAWRTVLHRLALIGQTPERYEGLGYGNVSIRSDGGFIISGTQTGYPAVLGHRRYVRVLSCDPGANRIVSEGLVRPSSESLTHGAVYAADPATQCVLHAHSPEVWQQMDHLKLPSTPADVPYGTPEMAGAVEALFGESDLPMRRIFATRGHEDGVFAIGPDPASAGSALVSILAEALTAA